MLEIPGILDASLPRRRLLKLGSYGLLGTALNQALLEGQIGPSAGLSRAAYSCTMCGKMCAVRNMKRVHEGKDIQLND